jgi:hypothetical protein
MEGSFQMDSFKAADIITGHSRQIEQFSSTLFFDPGTDIIPAKGLPN